AFGCRGSSSGRAARGPGRHSSTGSIGDEELAFRGRARPRDAVHEIDAHAIAAGRPVVHGQGEADRRARRAAERARLTLLLETMADVPLEVEGDVHARAARRAGMRAVDLQVDPQGLAA